MYVYACIYVHTCYEYAPVSPKNPRSAGPCGEHRSAGRLVL
jgi:hypothetical protein